MAAKAIAPDVLLKKLRKLDSNMSCPNCGTPAQHGIGFGNVCVKFKTFVCDSCKTSHQAISHRVKSITMSNWTAEEVNELVDANGGGNAAALHVWLKNAPHYGGKYPGGARPKPGDKIEIFKQFVLDCYEYQKFVANSPYVPDAASARKETKGAVSAATHEIPAQAIKSGSVTAQFNPKVNSSLIDFGDDFGGNSWSAQSPVTSAKAVSQSNSNNDFFNAFSDSSSDPFSSSATTSSAQRSLPQELTTATTGSSQPSAAAQPQAQTHQSFDMFGSASSSPVPDFFGDAGGITTKQAHEPFGGDFGAFGGSTSPARTDKVGASVNNDSLLFLSHSPSPTPIAETAQGPLIQDPFGSELLQPMRAMNVSPQPSAYGGFNQSAGSGFSTQQSLATNSNMLGLQLPAPPARNGNGSGFGFLNNGMGASSGAGMGSGMGSSGSGGMGGASPMMLRGGAMGGASPGTTYQQQRTAYNSGMSISQMQIPPGPSTAAMRGASPYGAQPQAKPANQPDSFNFLQETMRNHLNSATTASGTSSANASSVSGNNRNPPPNPFKM